MKSELNEQNYRHRYAIAQSDAAGSAPGLARHPDWV